ncbi:polysaccharide biosynthesis family protein, partial [Listeria innocua FSL S4-378]
KIIVPAVGVGIGLIVKWITGSILIPRLATIGASLSTCIGLLIVLIICYVSLKQTIRVPFVEKTMILRLVAALALMAVVPCLFEWFAPLSTRLGSAFQAITSAAIGGSVFLVFALRYKLLGPKDFVFLPFGSKLLALSKFVARK